ncbi:hypothetical protein LINPERPRIM_LOCUS30419 [Linum perenne]
MLLLRRAEEIHQQFL